MLITWNLVIYTFKITVTSPRGQWVNVCSGQPASDKHDKWILKQNSLNLFILVSIASGGWWCQAIPRTSADRDSQAKFDWNLNQNTILILKICLKMLPAKFWPFCLGLIMFPSSYVQWGPSHYNMIQCNGHISYSTEIMNIVSSIALAGYLELTKDTP